MSSLPIIVTNAWKAKYPGVVVGILAIRGVENPASHPTIDVRKKNAEDALRKQFAGNTREDLKKLDRMKAYEAYYGPYGKTYHVLLQLESIALKGKPIASSGALVQVMFIAEVGNMLLTAGHDLDRIVTPVTLDIAKGTETYTQYRGNPQTPKADDMMMTDGEGIISCVLHGPDQRTRITDATKNVLFAVYGPAGIGADAMRKHLEEMRDGALLIAPGAVTEMLEVHVAQ